MSSGVCRLCLNSDNVVDIFHADLTNSKRLRTCIMLATGVNFWIPACGLFYKIIYWRSDLVKSKKEQISEDDVVSKYVCAACCDMSVKLYKFRVNALVNDRALKVAYRQTCQKSPLKVDEMIAMNTGLMEKFLFMEKCNVKESPKRRNSYAVHPSVVRLMKTNENLIIPNEFITADLEPKVYLKPLALKDLFKSQYPSVDVNVVHEARKRPYAEPEEVQEKRLKIDVPFVTPAVEASKCLKDTKNLNESRPKTPCKISYKIVESQRGKENDVTNKIVLSRVITNDCDDDSGDDYQPHTDDGSSSDDSSDTMTNLSRKAFRFRKSRFLTDDETDDDSSSSLLETVDEENAYNCEICNKTFDHIFKLKVHKRCHKNCLICKAAFRSSDALSYHQTNVCFKRLLSQPPMLCLKRCDITSEIEVIKTQNPSIALNLGSRSEEDEVLLISDDEESTIEGLSPSEATYTRSLFEKYRNLRDKSKPTEAPTIKILQSTSTNTDNKININAPNDHTIIIEGMFVCLHSHRLPIKQHVAPVFSAHLEHQESRDAHKERITWSGDVKQLSNKPTVLKGLLSKPTVLNGLLCKPTILNGQKRSLPTPVPNIYKYQAKSVLQPQFTPSVNNQGINHSVAHPRQYAGTAPQTKSFVTSTPVTAQRDMLDVEQQLSYEVIQKPYVTPKLFTAAQKTAQNIMLQTRMIEQDFQSIHSYRTYTGPNVVQKNGLGIGQKKDQPMLCPSTNEKPCVTNNCFLRVKTPSELTYSR